MNPPCYDCEREMTDKEVEMYTFRCEACERIWHVRVQTWKHGGTDPILEKLFNDLARREPVH